MPTTVILNNPTVDVQISRHYATGVYTRVTSPVGGLYFRKWISLSYHGYHSYIEWPIILIPPGAIITNIVLKYEGLYNLDSSNLGRVVQMTNRDIDYPDDNTGNQNFFNDAGDGNEYYSANAFPTVGTNKTITLGPLANSDLQAKRSAGINWFAIGLTLDAGSSYKTIKSKNQTGGAIPVPTLEVTYEIYSSSRDLDAVFEVGQNSVDLQAHFTIRQKAIDLKSIFMIRQIGSASLQAGFRVNQSNGANALRAKFWIHKTYDLTGALGIGFYWWGSGVVEGDQNVEFQLLTPTGGWIAHFPDGDPEWRWVLLPFEDRDPFSEQRLIEVDFGGSWADKSEVEAFLWTYFSEGVRRMAYLCIWYGGDLKAQFTVRHPGSSSLKGVFNVNHP